jgi:hypothetical protein
MTATNDTPTEADRDDDYLDDVIVRSAMERLRREFENERDVVAVTCKRFDYSDKTDYIDVKLEDHAAGNSYSLAAIVQSAVDTGVVTVEKIDAQDDRLQFLPTEA